MAALVTDVTSCPLFGYSGSECPTVKTKEIIEPHPSTRLELGAGTFRVPTVAGRRSFARPSPTKSNNRECFRRELEDCGSAQLKTPKPFFRDLEVAILDIDGDTRHAPHSGCADCAGHQSRGLGRYG
jgi:hypothetical protein